MRQIVSWPAAKTAALARTCKMPQVRQGATAMKKILAVFAAAILLAACGQVSVDTCRFKQAARVSYGMPGAEFASAPLPGVWRVMSDQPFSIAIRVENSDYAILSETI